MCGDDRPRREQREIDHRATGAKVGRQIDRYVPSTPRASPFLASVTCTIVGVTVPVQYPGAQGAYNGLDQVSISFTAQLQGVW